MAVSLLILIASALIKNSVQEYVYLSNLGLSSIQEDMVTETVTVLKVDRNQIFELDSIPEMPFLTYIYLGRNRLYEFPNLENVAGTLHHLYLEYNNISYINPDRLDSLTSLQYLGLTKNPIASIPDVAGPSLTLLHLDLDYAMFSDFPDWEFLGNSLTTLDLKVNKISEVTEEMFRNMTQLKNLALDQNLITSSQFSLPATLKLLTLTISQNELTIFPDVRNITTLTSLSVYNNKLSLVPEEILKCLTSLVSLSIYGNNISFDGIPDLVELNLTTLTVGANPITEFPRWTHLGRSLITLKLSYTKITELTDDDLDYYPSLTYLDLSNSNFSEFPYLPRNGPQLKTLLLNYNKIERIPESHLQPLQNSSKIGCAVNRLVSVPNICVANFIPNFLLDLNYNYHLECDVGMVWALGAMEVIPSYRLSLSSSKCKQPQALSGRTVLTVPIAEMENPIGTTFINREYFPIVPPFNCYMPITVLLSTPNSVVCAVTCSQTPSCLLFGFAPDVGDDLNDVGTCAITTMAGTALLTDLDFKWFAPL